MEGEEGKLRDIKDARKHWRSNSTKMINSLIQTISAEFDINVLNEDLGNIKECRDKLHNLETSFISQLTILSRAYSDADKVRHDKYIENLKMIEKALSDQIDKVCRNPVPQSVAIGTGLLPDVLKTLVESVKDDKSNLKLPTYDPDVENSDFMSFIAEIEAFLALHAGWSEARKFSLLREHVDGRAKKLLLGIPFTEQNFADAKEMIKNAFADVEKDKQLVMKTLTSLSFKDCCEYFAKVNNIKKLVKYHNITIDDVLQFHCWRALPSSLRSNLMHLTGESHPSVDLIMKHVFSAQRRVDEFAELRKEPVKSSYSSKTSQPNKGKKEQIGTFATNIGPFKGRNKPTDKNNDKKADFNTPNKGAKNDGAIANKTGARPKKGKAFCCLCFKDNAQHDHNLENCFVYKTPIQKVTRLTELSACTLCGFLNHDKDSCKMLNRLECRKCKGVHFTPLCVKEQAAQTASGSVTGATGLATISATGTDVLGGSSALLPTLSVEIGNEKAHAMIDSGSQLSFIREELIHKHKLKILRNRVPLSINGVNSTKNYVIKEVIAPIKVGNCTIDMKCYTLPKIDLQLNVPGIRELVQDYASLNFQLADEKLNILTSDHIDHFDIIIGIGDFAKLNLKTVFIGNSCAWELNDKSLIIFGYVNELHDDVSEVLQMLAREE